MPKAIGDPAPNVAFWGSQQRRADGDEFRGEAVREMRARVGRRGIRGTGTDRAHDDSRIAFCDFANDRLDGADA